MIKAAVILTTGRRKTRRLEKISYRRSTESLLNLPGDIYLGSDDLIIFVRPIIRLH